MGVAPSFSITIVPEYPDSQAEGTANVMVASSPNAVPMVVANVTAEIAKNFWFLIFKTLLLVHKVSQKVPSQREG
jgi:hypothetical protein